MKTHIANRPFKNWSPTEHQTWKKLAERQIKNAEKKMSQRFFDGVKKLEIDIGKVPDFTKVNQNLEWELVSTNLEFADGQTWFELLSHNQFLVTEYIRPLESLDYTPKPDIFHDAFGHLPFLADPQMSRIIRKFTKLQLAQTGEMRKKLGHIWWYTIEFGLVKEHGEVRAIGAGLGSSFGELRRVFEGRTKLSAFSVEKVGQTPESPTQFHEELFVLESLDQLEKVLDCWAGY